MIKNKDDLCLDGYGSGVSDDSTPCARSSYGSSYDIGDGSSFVYCVGFGKGLFNWSGSGAILKYTNGAGSFYCVFDSSGSGQGGFCGKGSSDSTSDVEYLCGENSGCGNGKGDQK